MIISTRTSGQKKSEIAINKTMCGTQTTDALRLATMEIIATHLRRAPVAHSGTNNALPTNPKLRAKQMMLVTEATRRKTREGKNLLNKLTILLTSTSIFRVKMTAII